MSVFALALLLAAGLGEPGGSAAHSCAGQWTASVDSSALGRTKYWYVLRNDSESPRRVALRGLAYQFEAKDHTTSGGDVWTLESTDGPGLTTSQRIIKGGGTIGFGIAPAFDTKVAVRVAFVLWLQELEWQTGVPCAAPRSVPADIVTGPGVTVQQTLNVQESHDASSLAGSLERVGDVLVVKLTNLGPNPDGLCLRDLSAQDSTGQRKSLWSYAGDCENTANRELINSGQTASRLLSADALEGLDALSLCVDKHTSSGQPCVLSVPIHGQ